MANYRCSGRGPATQVNCDFHTDSLSQAAHHFEHTGHDVDEVAAPVCADCGLSILDGEDIDVTLDSNGNVVTTLHTDAYHRDLFPDDETGPSPYDYDPLAKRS